MQNEQPDKKDRFVYVLFGSTIVFVVAVLTKLAAQAPPFKAGVSMLIRAGLVPEAHETVRRNPDAVPGAHVPSKLRIPRL